MTCRHVSEYVRASVFVGFVALVLPMSFLKSPVLEIFECVHVSEHFALLVMIYRCTFGTELLAGSKHNFFFLLPPPPPFYSSFFTPFFYIESQKVQCNGQRKKLF